MANATPIHEIHQGQAAKNALEDVLREGARQLLQTAIEEEGALQSRSGPGGTLESGA